MADDRMWEETGDNALARLAKSSQELALALADAERDLALARSANEPREQTAQETLASVSSTPPASSPRPTGALGRLRQTLAWPVRRLLDPRFRGLARQIDEKQLELFDRLDRLRAEDLRLNHERIAGQTRLVAMLEQESAASYGLSSALVELQELVKSEKELVEESTAVLGSTLAGVRSDTDAIATTLGGLSNELAEIRSAGAGALLVGSSVEHLDEGTARLLDFAESHSGFAAQRLLWFNPPVALRHVQGSVEVAGVNERIAEIPFAFRALSRVPRGSSILDVGATESTLSLSLASLGYSVTAIDPRPYPIRHPNLEVVVGEVQRWSPTSTFDAIVCLSTIEHVGLGAYGDQRASGRPDLEVMAKLREVSRPDTVLVLTTRFGRASRNWLERTYDAAEFQELLDGWEIEESVVVRRDDGTTWTPDGPTRSTPEDEAVIMVVGRRGR